MSFFSHLLLNIFQDQITFEDWFVLDHIAIKFNKSICGIELLRYITMLDVKFQYRSTNFIM